MDRGDGNTMNRNECMWEACLPVGGKKTGRFHMVPPADPVVQGSQELDFWVNLFGLSPHRAFPPRLAKTAPRVCLAEIPMGIWGSAE